MTGLYIHIPFCKSRCIYCGFYSTTLLELRQQYLNAVIREMSMRPTDDIISTIYLGGGTPSQLTDDQLRKLFDAIYNIYNVSEDAEVTIECNPDDITEEFARMLASLPVNRVSMGVQTFSDARLSFLRRRHKAADVSQAVCRLRSAGIGNISIDLMFGFPDETLSDWQSDIDAALALNPEHISAYSLMYEEGTVLFEQCKNLEIKKLSEETERQMYETLIDCLTTAGYDHYEISNFAKPSRHSRHNSSYWDGTPYIGIGAAAHSYDLQSRQWNISDIRQYIKDIAQGIRPYEQELLDDDTRYNDLITTALRTKDGIHLSALTDKYRTYLLANAQPSITRNLLRIDDDHIHLTRQGLFVSDDVMSDLFCVY